jgi:hypothetical protein
VVEEKEIDEGTNEEKKDIKEDPEKFLEDGVKFAGKPREEEPVLSPVEPPVEGGSATDLLKKLESSA